MSAYISVDWERCVRLGHHMSVFGSDKTPMKRSLLCKECSGDQKTAVVATGVEFGSWGIWRRPRVFAEELNDETP